MGARPPKGTPTDTNLYVLHRTFRAGSALEVGNSFEATSLSHLRRCMAAGLCEPAERDGVRVLRLTEAGKLAVSSYEERAQKRKAVRS